MHDAQYRAEVARQNTAYNQPAYTSFYFASDTDWANVPVPDIQSPGVLTSLENLMEVYTASGELKGPLVSQLNNTVKQAKHHLDNGSVEDAVKFMEKFILQLGNKKQDGISPRADKNLTYHANVFIEMWK